MADWSRVNGKAACKGIDTFRQAAAINFAVVLQNETVVVVFHTRTEK